MYNVATVKTEQGEIIQLCNDDYLMVCPYKTSTANMQAEKQKTLQHGWQNVVAFKGYITQACDSTCPLFEYQKEKNAVITYCGCTPRALKIEEIKPAQKEASQPGAGLTIAE